MKQKTIIAARDIINFLLFFGTLYGLTWYTYNSEPELINLKNILFPMRTAILLCVIASLNFIILNRITTYLAIKIIQKQGEKQN